MSFNPRNNPEGGWHLFQWVKPAQEGEGTCSKVLDWELVENQVYPMYQGRQIPVCLLFKGKIKIESSQDSRWSWGSIE